MPLDDSSAPQTGTPSDPVAGVTFVPLPRFEDAGTERQRLRVHVPTPGGDTRGTTMVLGQALPGAAYTGFGVRTYGHVVVRAVGGEEGGTMGLAADGRVLLQSNHREVYVQAARDAVHGAGGGMFVSGRDGVTLYAGHAPETPDPAPWERTPAYRHDGPKFAERLAGVAAFWERAESVAGHRGAVQAERSAALHPPGWSGHAPADDDKAAAAFRTGQAESRAARHGQVPRGVSVYGEGGVLVGTPAVLTAAGATRVTVQSEGGVSVGGATVDVHAERTVALAAGANAMVAAGGRVSVLGAAGVEVSSGPGEVALHGAQVVIGSHDALHDAQVPTHTVDVAALEAVRVHTRGEGSHDGIHLNAEGGGLFAYGDDHAEVVSQKSVDIRVGPYAVMVRPDGIKIGLAKSPGDAPTEAMVTIEDGKIVLSTRACGLVASDDDVAVGTVDKGRFKTGVKFSKAGNETKITGDKVKIL